MSVKYCVVASALDFLKVLLKCFLGGAFKDTSEYMVVTEVCKATLSNSSGLLDFIKKKKKIETDGYLEIYN